MDLYDLQQHSPYLIPEWLHMNVPQRPIDATYRPLTLIGVDLDDGHWKPNR
jgi:hypothetical protein